MPRERIEPASWAPFLEGFAGQHRGWLVTVAQTGSAGNQRVVIDQQPLLDVAIDGDAIEISTGIEDSGHSRHRIDNVTDVLVDRAGGDAVAALRIVSRSGETLIRFRVVISPELVDGMV